MKKIFAKFIVLMICAMLGVGAFAETVTEPPVDTVIESVTESGITEIAVTDESTFDGLIEGLTNSTLGMVLIGLLSAVITCIVTFRKNFGVIADLVSKKADEKAISSALKKTTEELSATFNAKLTEIELKMNDTNDNEKILTTILTIFMTNANINPNAKAEIMQYLTGLKDTNGKVTEIVDKANKIIEEANAAEVKAPTPALDTIVAEEETNDMVLG